MAKVAVSVTLDADNLLWLRARAAQRKRRSLSDTIDEVLTAARTGGKPVGEIRSVVGTVTFTDEDLREAEAEVRALFEASADRWLEVHEPQAVYQAPRRKAGVQRVSTRVASSAAKPSTARKARRG